MKKMVLSKIDESVKQIEGIYSKSEFKKTDILNVQYNSGVIHSCMDMLEKIDMDLWVETYDKIKPTTTKALEIVEHIY